MQVDNFDRLRNIVEFKEGYFHLLYIIQRDKDHKDDGVYINYDLYTAHTIKYWPVTSMEDLNKIEPEVKQICKDTESRAYFILNLIHIIEFNDYCRKYIMKLHEKYGVNIYTPGNILYMVKGKKEPNSDIIKYCHLDLDNDLSSEENVKRYIDLLHEFNPDIKIIDNFPTKTGSHLITSAYDLNTYYEYAIEHIQRVPRSFKYVGVLIYLNISE